MTFLLYKTVIEFIIFQESDIVSQQLEQYY